MPSEELCEECDLDTTVAVKLLESTVVNVVPICCSKSEIRSRRSEFRTGGSESRNCVLLKEQIAKRIYEVCDSHARHKEDENLLYHVVNGMM